MGGHANGDVAAQAVVDEIARVRPASGQDLEAAIGFVNRMLWQRGRDGGGGISGATIAALILTAGFYEGRWAGDSQIWRLRDGWLGKLTRDHSIVEDLVRAGLIAESERNSHPQSHVITRAIGVADTVVLDQETGATQAGDLFLLCSDGLTGAVERKDIELIVTQPSLDKMADELMARALANGASDNVTFILVRLDAPN
jgi:protein phosphatase